MLPSPSSHNGFGQSSPLLRRAPAPSRQALVGTSTLNMAPAPLGTHRALHALRHHTMLNQKPSWPEVFNARNRSLYHLLGPTPPSNRTSPLSHPPRPLPSSQRGCICIGTHLASSQKHCQLNRKKTRAAERTQYVTGSVGDWFSSSTRDVGAELRLPKPISNCPQASWVCPNLFGPFPFLGHSYCRRIYTLHRS